MYTPALFQDIDSIKTIKEPIPVLIVGNKCDLDDLRRVTFKEGKKVPWHHHSQNELMSAMLQTISRNWYQTTS